jgi:O-antigen/teichoic acid export membrane protein
MGVVALGGFLINRANVLVLSTFIGLQASGAYAISLQLLTAPAAVALLPTQIGLPTLVAARVRDDRMTLRRLFLRRHLAMIVIFSTSALLLALIANPALELLGSHTQVLAPPLFLLLAAIVLLETNHSNCAFLIMTGNNVPFVPAALLSGLATLGLAVAAARSGAGIVGVMLAQCVVQLAYNNWKWPLEAWKELR